jgi:hypothetical protein
MKKRQSVWIALDVPVCDNCTEPARWKYWPNRLKFPQYFCATHKRTIQSRAKEQTDAR